MQNSTNRGEEKNGSSMQSMACIASSLSRLGVTDKELARYASQDHLDHRLLDLARRIKYRSWQSHYALELDHVLEIVRSWPGVTEEAIQEAIQDAQTVVCDDGVVANDDHIGRKYDYARDDHPLLRVVVTVYKATPHETFLYALERIKETYGESVCDLDPIFASDEFQDCIRLRETAAPDYRNCIKIELVNFGTHALGVSSEGDWSTKRNGAHASALFALAQHIELIADMKDEDDDGMWLMPLLQIYGYSARFTSDPDHWAGWEPCPEVWVDKGILKIFIGTGDGKTNCQTQPILWVDD